ncbi:ead/Ea22-like family protein [Escherichia coli]
MTNSTAINYQALREIAKLATQGEWVAFISPGTDTYAVHTPGDERCGDIVKWPGFDDQKNAENNAEFIAAFNPEVVQALLDEREAQSKRIAELEASCAALAAENAGLKAGAMYFSYGSEFSFECHKTAEEAIAAAEAAIDDYRGDACDGWSEEVESICWGVIIQQATKVGERKKRKCDRVSPWIERVCDYELRPNVETPATDAFLAEVRAQGVEMLAKNHQSIVNALKGDSLFSDGEYRHAIIASAATSFAAQLRKGGNQ